MFSLSHYRVACLITMFLNLQECVAIKVVSLNESSFQKVYVDCNLTFITREYKSSYSLLLLSLELRLRNHLLIEFDTYIHTVKYILCFINVKININVKSKS